jgi:hypothetical protein
MATELNLIKEQLRSEARRASTTALDEDEEK